MSTQENNKTQQELWDILNREYEQVVQEADGYIRWYERNRMWKRNASRFFRALSIIAVAVGTLCPLIDAAYPSTSRIFGQWGYVAFALAAAFVGADRFFGLSSSWMRYMIARLELDRALKEFHFEWTRLTAEIKDKPLSSERFEVCLKTIQTFTLRVQDIIKRETEGWITEFQRSLAELEKAVQAEVRARKPGDLSVTVTNASEFDGGLTLSVAGRDRTFEGSSTLLNDIPPGRYEVRVVGKKGGKTSSDVEVAEVLPGDLTKVEMTLPIS
jgi:hypothetical protein